MRTIRVRRRRRTASPGPRSSAATRRSVTSGSAV